MTQAAGRISLQMTLGEGADGKEEETIDTQLQSPDYLDDRGAIDYCHVTKFGLFYHYVMQGAQRAFINASLYPFFKRYLNTPGHSFKSIGALWSAFWVLKFVFGLVSDLFPVWGRRRRPYMALGWCLLGISILLTGLLPYPQPYYHVDVENCTFSTSEVNNPSAADSAFLFALLLGLAKFGVSLVDVTADALMVEYTRREPKISRGKANAFAHFFDRVGRFGCTFVVLFLFNGPSYRGGFCFEVQFNHACLVFSAISLVAIFNTALFVVEDKQETSTDRVKLLKQLWQELQSPVYHRVATMVFLLVTMLNLQSSAAVNVKSHFADVQPLVQSANTMLVTALSALGIWLVKDYFLHTDWRVMLASTSLFIVIVQAVVELFTVYDVVRNQFFYFTDEVLMGIPEGLFLIVIMNIVAEICHSGLEGIMFGLTMSVWTLGGPVGTVLSNLASAGFGVVGDERFDRDSTEDRHAIAGSFVVVYALQLLLLPCILLAPRQKEEVRDMKAKEVHSPVRGVIFISVFLLLLAFSLVMNLLTIIESTNCYLVLGGGGCS